MQLIIEMTEAELFALDMIAADKQEWADNVLTNRARVAKEVLKTKPEWAQALSLVAQSGGDISNDWAVLLAGRDATPALFETAAIIQARNEAARLAEEQTQIETPETISEAHVQQVAVQRQIAALNAFVTDGTVVSNLAELLVKKADVMADMMSLIDAKMDLGGTLPVEHQTTLTRAKAGQAFLKSIDAAAVAIKADVASGTISEIDAIATDLRWPALPSE